MSVYSNGTAGPDSNTFQRLLKSIDGIDLGDYAIRGMTATLAPIQGTDGLVRAVDGTLMDWTAPQFRKLQVSISCSDIDAPVLTDIWQGQIITCEFEPGMGPSNGTDGSLSITTMLDTWSITRDDYGCETGWQLNLLEI